MFLCAYYHYNTKTIIKISFRQNKIIWTPRTNRPYLRRDGMPFFKNVIVSTFPRLTASLVTKKFRFQSNFIITTFYYVKTCITYKLLNPPPLFLNCSGLMLRWYHNSCFTLAALRCANIFCSGPRYNTSCLRRVIIMTSMQAMLWSVCLQYPEGSSTETTAGAGGS